MKVGLLIISHDQIGSALFEIASQTLGGCPLAAKVLGASKDCDPELLLKKARQAVVTLDQGSGVLVLTDLYGSTPYNIAAQLMNGHRVRIVTGVNLPMLIRVLNYPQLDLNQLVEKAISGGREGVFTVNWES